MNTDTGTNEAERGLNVPKSEEELASQILIAVSEGDSDEMDRLFAIQLEPAATDEEEDDSVEDSTADKTDEASDEEDAGTEDDSEEDTSEEASRTTTQDTSPAEERLIKLEKQLNDANAAVGRMSTLQSRLVQLERQLKKSKSDSKQAEVDEVENKLRERIAALKEVDPATAEILEALAADRKPAKAVETEEDAGVDPAVLAEYEKVLAVHTDAGDVFQHPYWHMWKKNLTPAQRAWAESSNSAHVIEALNSFKGFMQGFGKTEQAAPEAKTDDVVDATKTARDKKLQRSAESSDKPVKKGAKFDPDTFFNESYEQIAKDSGITY